MIVCLVAVMVVATVVGVRLGRGRPAQPPAPGCVARVGSREADVDGEQARNAAEITAVALRRGLPRRAVVVALATAFQESKLRNLDYGDADSLGLFQQRPSQGWGTAAQVRDPAHATGSFFDALVRLPGWEQLPVTVAAQRVQRSAYPDAYAVHEPAAAVLADALTGSPAGLACTPVSASAAGPAALLAAVRATFTRGAPKVGVVRTSEAVPPGSTATPATPASSLTLSVRPGRSVRDATASAWVVGSWLVANADHLGVGAVRVGNRRWTAAGGSDGWAAVPAAAPADSPRPAGTAVTVVAASS